MIPDTGISKIVGLVQIVRDNGAKMSMDDIAKAYLVELENLLLAVQGAEALGLVTVDNGNVKLTTLGKKLVTLDIPKRKKLLKKQMQGMHVFKIINTMPQVAAGEKVHKKHVISVLAKYYPKKEAERQFRKIVEWGRYVQAINYDADTEHAQLLP